MSYVLDSPGTRKKIAIVGSGIAGLSAAWMINKTHDVSVFEVNSHIGGHSNTVTVKNGDTQVPVDTGFIVYNEHNYPNLTALFNHLGVPTRKSDMSFAASIDNGTFEYSGNGIGGLLGQPGNILNPRFWAMVSDIIRFYRSAPAMARQAHSLDLTLGAFLSRERYSGAFIDNHILPMGAAIWSSSVTEMMEFPLAAFVRFFENHGLLKLSKRPSWRTVKGGSVEYVKRLTRPFADAIQHTGVTRIERKDCGIILETENAQRLNFDDVVIATHADEAIRLLADPVPAEKSLLGAFRYTRNKAFLHTDTSLMPRRRRIWSSWNYTREDKAHTQKAPSVTYWMNRLQKLSYPAPLFVTLNPPDTPRNGTVLRSFSYSHPLFDKAALSAQQRLSEIQGQRNTWFCGSYFGYGFHEDALQSGLFVGEALSGTARPWNVDGSANRIDANPSPMSRES